MILAAFDLDLITWMLGIIKEMSKMNKAMTIDVILHWYIF